MIRASLGYDVRGLRAFDRRIDATLREHGDVRWLAKARTVLLAENQRARLAGEDKSGGSMRGWKVRRGRSDYHGADYERFTERAVLVPFGVTSRAIDGFEVQVSGGASSGTATVRGGLVGGWTGRSVRVLRYQARKGRDILGMNPRMRREIDRVIDDRRARIRQSWSKRGVLG